LYLWVFPIFSAMINVIPVMVQTVMFDPRHFKLLINFCRWQSNIMKRYYNMGFFLAVSRCILWFLKFNAHIFEEELDVISEITFLMPTSDFMQHDVFIY
jgi:hypothetical protein